MVNIPETSPDMACRFWLHDIARNGKMEDVKEFIVDKKNIEPKKYDSMEDFLNSSPNYEAESNSNLSADEKSAIKEYSGYNFSWINSVARGFWDYERMGERTKEKENNIRESIEKILEGISKSPETTEDFVTFRGTSLRNFRGYNINSLSDLKKMEGQFKLEQGFTSTTLEEENDFASKETESFLIDKPNIIMRYHIPAGTKDTIALSSEDLTYSPNQTEVLIDNNSLFYISNVNLDENNLAIVDAILIPREIYDSRK